MHTDHIITGDVTQYEEPDWEPLRELIGMELADWFMWMHEIELDDGATVHAYKHITTRRYFHLAVDGRAFTYTSGGFYREIEPRLVIDLVFEEWDKYPLYGSDPDVIRRELRRVRRAATVRASRRAAQKLDPDERSPSS